MNKNYFTFGFFDELQIGDVFKFCPVIDGDMPSKFYTVYQKTDTMTKFNSTYGKNLHKMELRTDAYKEIMLFPNRKK